MSRPVSAELHTLIIAANSYHIDLNMDIVIQAIIALFTLITNKAPRFKVHGGTPGENLALQNIQVSRGTLHPKHY